MELNYFHISPQVTESCTLAISRKVSIIPLAKPVIQSSCPKIKRKPRYSIRKKNNGRRVSKRKISSLENNLFKKILDIETMIIAIYNILNS